jgi:DNA-directed RNA polymerase subunit RPC12/RpoP
MRVREERIRDLGGLMLEMHKRDRVRPELLGEQCAEVVTIEERIAAIDDVLSAMARPVRAQNACACGAPLAPGAHFCANCGRPTAADPVVSCAHCGEPLPAEASYCAHCGRAAEATAAPLHRAVSE